MQNKFNNFDESELYTVDEALKEYVENNKANCHRAKLALIKELKTTKAHEVSADSLADYIVLIDNVARAEALYPEVKRAWNKRQ